MLLLLCKMYKQKNENKKLPTPVCVCTRVCVFSKTNYSIYSAVNNFQVCQDYFLSYKCSGLKNPKTASQTGHMSYWPNIKTVFIPPSSVKNAVRIRINRKTQKLTWMKKIPSNFLSNLSMNMTKVTFSAYFVVYLTSYINIALLLVKKVNMMVLHFLISGQ